MAGLEGTVQLPWVGTVPRKGVAAGVATVAGIVGYAYWRRRGSSGVAVVDPGVTSDATAAASPNGDIGYTNPAPAGAVPDSTVLPAPTTNPEWTMRVTEDLETQGWDPTLIATVIGKYLSRAPLTTSEQVLVRAAWAYEGRPPESPPPIIAATETPTVPTTTKPASTVPLGPYGYHKTTKAMHTVPQIARHYGLTSEAVLRYNPGIAKGGYDLHNLPVGLTFAVPLIRK
jgi:hypothetical protein